MKQFQDSGSPSFNWIHPSRLPVLPVESLVSALETQFKKSGAESTLACPKQPPLDYLVP